MTKAQASDLGIEYPEGVTIPSIDAAIDACQEIALDKPDDRNQCYADFDKQVMEEAVPWVPYLWSKNITVTGTHRDQVRVRPVLRLPVVHADGGEQQAPVS